MESVWQTLDGNIYADKDTAIQHEMNMIRAKEQRLQRMKQKELPLAQRAYDHARKELAEFYLDLHHGKLSPHTRYSKGAKYEMSAILYKRLSSSYATLQARKYLYKKMKFELIQMKQYILGGRK